MNKKIKFSVQIRKLSASINYTSYTFLQPRIASSNYPSSLFKALNFNIFP